MNLYARSPFICRSIIRYPRMTDGGAKDVLSGVTSAKQSLYSVATISHTCRPNWDFTTLGCPKRARLKLSLHVNTGFQDSAIFITGFTAASSSNAHFKKFSSPPGQNFRFVFAGQMSHGAVVGSVRSKTF